MKGWFRASYADMRSIGSNLSSCMIKSVALFGTLYKASKDKFR